MIVALVHVGDKYSRQYVDYMIRAIDRHTKYTYALEVITESARPGWWAKTELFRPRDKRILYFDLDTLILGNLDPLFEYDGPFAILKDWYNPGYNSSVMSISPGFRPDLWSNWKQANMYTIGGDQDWITQQVPLAQVDLWQDICPGMIGSYKADELQEGPRDFSVVCFHGQPKMHEFTEGWVHAAWV